MQLYLKTSDNFFSKETFRKFFDDVSVPLLLFSMCYLARVNVLSMGPACQIGAGFSSANISFIHSFIRKWRFTS